MKQGFDLTGKALLIRAKSEGFRRGGIRHSVAETLHSVDEFTDEQLGQILADSGKNLIVKIVEVKPTQAEDVQKVADLIKSFLGQGKKPNVAELSQAAGFKVSGELKEQALKLLEEVK